MLPYRVRISCHMGSGKALGSGYAGGFGCGLRATHAVWWWWFITLFFPKAKMAQLMKS